LSKKSEVATGVCFEAKVYSSSDNLVLVAPEYQEDKDYPSGIFLTAVHVTIPSRGLREGDRVFVTGDLRFDPFCWGKDNRPGYVRVCAPVSHPIELEHANVVRFSASLAKAGDWSNVPYFRQLRCVREGRNPDAPIFAATCQ